tara:strand:+ start:357 stop:485 length:129 start_codon:yes stop_codon:yes gene_type:complete
MKQLRKKVAELNKHIHTVEVNDKWKSKGEWNQKPRNIINAIV